MSSDALEPGAGAGHMGSISDQPRLKLADEPLELGGQLVDSPDELDDSLEAGELSSDEPGDEPILDQAAVNRARAALPHRRYDWPAIKRRYVEGVKDDQTGLTDWPSLDDVARYFAAGPSRVREVAAKEGWRAQRTQLQAQVETTRRQARAAALSKEATNLDGRALDASKMGLSLVLHRLQQIAERRSVEEVDAQEQQRLAAAADLWHKVGLRAVGDPETHRLEITGANGAPIEIAAELRRDNPDRLADVIAVLQRAGIGDLFNRSDAEKALASPIIELEPVD